LFTSNGFANVTLQTNDGPLTVAADVDVTAQQKNLQFLPGAFSSPSANSLAGLTRIVMLPDNLRPAENVTLSTSISSVPSGIPDFSKLVRDALTIAAGARLALDPLGIFTAKADQHLLQNGSLLAPGGTVTLQVAGLVQSNAGVPLFFPDQGIWLGPQS